MAVLRVADLTKRFGKRTAVDDLSLDVRGGEVLGLLGPNGAGKTTTLLCTAGLLRPDSGAFTWNDAPLGSNRSQTVGLIPESPDVYPMLTVWEHMVFVAKSCRLETGWEARAGDLLRRLGMSDQRDTLGASLSKGMRQKTLIGATVLANTPVLLFDEPMIGLDPLGQRELRGIIGELRESGTAMIVSTHILEQAQTLCDRAVILKEGHNVASGTFEELRLRTTAGGTVEDVFLELTR
jgi:ABC-2 type transport system ATP-binding protein